METQHSALYSVPVSFEVEAADEAEAKYTIQDLLNLRLEDVESMILHDLQTYLRKLVDEPDRLRNLNDLNLLRHDLEHVHAVVSRTEAQRRIKATKVQSAELVIYGDEDEEDRRAIISTRHTEG
jgi:hypothetical protein